MGHRTRGLVFHNESGVEIGRLDGSRDEELFGASSVLIPRGAIGRILREKAEREGIPVFFGKRLVEIEEGRDGIRAVFEDGSEATASIAVGCDGVHSRTRRLLFPDAPAPRFGGLLDTGGISRRVLPNEDQVMHLVFGRRAFFGYFAAPEGTYWFSNVPWSAGDESLAPITFEAWRGRLLEEYRDDPEIVGEILREATAPLGRWKLYEMPSLPTGTDLPDRRCRPRDGAPCRPGRLARARGLARPRPLPSGPLGAGGRLRSLRKDAAASRRTGPRPCPPQREFQSAGWRDRAMVPRPHVAALSQGRGARRAAGLRLPPAVGGRLTRRSAFAPNGGGDDGWPRRRARKTSKRFSRREGPSARLA